MKPYPAYKDSGVDWLGQVPEGWGVVPIKRRFFVRLGKMLQPASKAEGDFEAPYLRAANIQWSGIDLNDIKTMWFSSSETETLGLRRGDLLVSEGGDVGRSALLEDDLEGVFFQNSVNRVRPRAKDSTRFLYYWLAAIKESGYVDVLCNKSTIAHFTAEKVEAVPVPLPPLPEQQVIAAFLDRETAKIDGLIEEQRRLIALLAEKRQATISHAVTRGLNPSARLKPSGVDWLGDIPEGWERVTLGRVCRSVSDGPHFSPSYVNEGYPFLSTRNISVERWQLDDVKYISEDDYLEFSKRVVPEVGDILYTKGGTTGIARVVDLDFPFQVWVHVAVLKIIPDVDPYFIAYALNSSACYEQSQIFTRGATNKDLGLTRMTKIWFALPPLNVQRQITDYLDHALSTLDALIDTATTAITLLQERRAALISAAVTGKIDVRDLALVSEAA